MNRATRGLGAILLALGMAISPSQAADTPSVDELLTRYAEARGGREAWRSVSSLELRGTYTAFSLREPFRRLQARPGLFRFDTVIRGAETTYAHDGQASWWLEPVFGMAWARRPPTPFNALLDRASAFEPPLLDAKAKGHTVELIGRGDIDGQPTWTVRLTLASSEVETWHLDVSTFLEVAIDSTTYDYTQIVDPIADRAYFSDFRRVGGLVIPHRVEREYLARHTVLEVAEARLDPPLDAALFRLPLPEGMERLRWLTGTWDLQIETRYAAESPWQTAQTTSTITPLLEGALLDERFTFELDGEHIEVLRQRSWDRFRDVYRFTHSDNVTFHLNVFEGSWNDDRIVVDNLQTASASRQEGQELVERQALYELTPEGFKLDIEQSTDGGVTWVTTAKYVYSRRLDSPFV